MEDKQIFINFGSPFNRDNFNMAHPLLEPIIITYSSPKHKKSERKQCHCSYRMDYGIFIESGAIP